MQIRYNTVKDRYPFLIIIFFALSLFTSLTSQAQIENPKIDSRFKNVQKKALDSHVNSQYRLANHYKDKTSADYNRHRAFYWHKVAADNGHEKSIIEVGDAYFYGSGTIIDYNKALIYYDMASNLGNQYGKMMKARLFFGDLKIPENLGLSKNILDSLVNDEYHRAGYLLAEFYMNGDLIEKDSIKAISLLLNARQVSYKNKMDNIVDCRLAEVSNYYPFNYQERVKAMYADGLTDLQANAWNSALKNRKKCYLNNNGNWKNYVCDLALIWRKPEWNRDFKKACEECLLYSKDTNKIKKVEYLYANYILRSRNSSAEDKQKALKIKEQQSAQDRYLQYDFGVLYRDGSDDVKKDLSKSISYFKAAAENELEKAYVPLGKLLIESDNAKNKEDGIIWLKKAKDYTTLAIYYTKGKHLPKDYEKAYDFAMQDVNWEQKPYNAFFPYNKSYNTDNLYIAIQLCNAMDDCKTSKDYKKLQDTYKSQTFCHSCGGRGKFICRKCNGSGNYDPNGGSETVECYICKGNPTIECATTINMPSEEVINNFKYIQPIRKEIKKPTQTNKKIVNNSATNTNDKEKTKTTTNTTGRLDLKTKNSWDIPPEGLISTIRIKKGEDVHIKAYGVMFSKLHKKKSSTDGIKGFDDYKIVDSIPFDALCVRVGENDEWKMLGSNLYFVSKHNGLLEFMINNKDSTDNEGLYRIIIKSIGRFKKG